MGRYFFSLVREVLVFFDHLVSPVFGSDVATCIVARGIRFDFWGYLGMDWVVVRSLVGVSLRRASSVAQDVDR